MPDEVVKSLPAPLPLPVTATTKEVKPAVVGPVKDETPSSIPFHEPVVETKAPELPKQARKLSPRDQVTHDKLLKELDTIQNGRALGDITLKDAYWAKREELNVFMANVVYV